jgi:hypothetical protein
MFLHSSLSEISELCLNFLSISSIIQKCKAYKKCKKEHRVPLYPAEQYFIYSSMYDISSNPNEFKISSTMSEKPFHDWGEYGSPFTAFT